MIRSLIAAAGLSLALAAPASAVTFVAGPDSARQQQPCTRDLPCALPYAVSTAQASDEVVLLAGTYEPSSTIPIKAGLTVRGDDGALPIVAFVSGLFSLGGTEAQRPRLSRVDVRRVEGTAVEVRAWGILEEAIVSSTGDDRAAITVTGNGALVRNVVSRMAGTGAAAVRAQDMSPSTSLGRLVNVTAIAAGSGSRGIEALGRSDADPGFDCSFKHARLALTNVIARGEATDAGTRETPDPGCTAITTEITVEHSNLTGYEGEVTLGAGNQLGNLAPVFADEGSLRQRVDSPTVDAGTAATLVAGFDLDGDARSLGAAPDIGADELPTAPTVTAPVVNGITQTTATLGGSFGAGSRPTTGLFDWGPSPAYGSVTGETSTPGPLGSTLTGLQPGTTYHVRVRAFTPAPQAREAVSPDVTFTTLPAGAGGDPVGLKVAGAIRKRKLLRRGLKIAFLISQPGSAYEATLTAKRGKRRVRLAGGKGSGLPVGATKARLKARGKAVRRLGRRTGARLVLRITEPGGAVLVRSAKVTVKR